MSVLSRLCVAASAIAAVAVFFSATPAGATNDPCAWPGSDEAKLYAFLENRCYASWTRDSKVRDTGPYLNESTVTDGDLSFGVHPAVRIYYNPPAWEWVEGGRKGEIPDDALLVKEMYNPPAQRYGGMSDGELDKQLCAWTTMVRSADVSADGWYWSYHGNPASVHADCRPATPSRDTFEERVAADLAYPDSGYGLYCTRCHSSAVKDNTFSTARNVTGEPLTYLVTPPVFGPEPEQADGDAHAASAAGAAQASPQLPEPLAKPRKDFLAFFNEIPPVPTREVQKHAMPPETFDHVYYPADPDKAVQFVTSDQCIGCHDATEGIQWNPPMLFTDKENGTILNFSPYAEWRMSMMGLAGRDPIFFAQLESERNIHSAPELQASTQNLCLHCHGVMGQRQYVHDNPGKQFSRAMAQQYSPDLDENAKAPYKYGALARDGISCAVCHHIVEEGLGTPASFTGDFKVGPSDEIYGPFKEPLPRPMQDGVGMTPKQSDVISSSKLCGSCHTVHLPVYDGSEPVPDPHDPSKQKYIFEQTTYLEWLNSIFWQEGTAQSCQDCHMRTHHQGEELSFRIAAIETDDYPDTDNRLPDEEIDLQPRKPFSRHTLLGINLFGMEMFQQFPDILGIRTQDPMAPPQAQPPWLTAEQAAVHQAREESAEIAIDPVTATNDALQIPVSVTNLTGHKFPSGVGFRRAFLELTVADSNGNVLWGSGRTNALGVIVDGEGKPLPSESVGTDTQAYQPHYRTVDAEHEVQIYEILEQNAQGRFTTSFLGLDNTIKDNRLLPKGWSLDGPYAEETKACEYDPNAPGTGHEKCVFLDEPGYNDGTGSDHVAYVVACQAGMRDTLTVSATLYYQAIPPYYLKQRFATAQGPDAQRLHHFGSHLNVADTPINNWKLKVVGTRRTILGDRLCGG